MGINNLNKFLRNNCPHIYEEIHLSEYSYKKIAIDISLYLCKFKTVCGDNWLNAFINLIACLRRNEVHCTFIYDSGAPPEKDLERKERAAQREKIIQKVTVLEEAFDKYQMTNEIDSILIDLYNKRKDKQEPKRLLQKKNNINMKLVEESIKKMRSHILNISYDDFQLTKKLFDILNVPYYNAPLEAETMCSDLCKRELVDAVLSEDTDVLAYASPIFLSKINTKNETCIRINYDLMLESLNLKCEQFLDLCIMCGTDYNKNIFRVGPEKAYKYILDHYNIEGIAKNTSLDISILNHIRGRELFRDYEKLDIIIPYCGSPEFNKLSEFIAKHNIYISLEYLKKSFIQNTTIIFDDNDPNINEVKDDESVTTKIENLLDDIKIDDEETFEIEIE